MRTRRRPRAGPVAGVALAVWLAPAEPLAAQLSAGFSVASFQLNLSNPGARSLGMGGAFTARADDATAAYANPAGLMTLPRPELSFEGRSATFRLPLVAAEPVVNGFSASTDAGDRVLLEGTSAAAPLGSPDATDATASFLSLVLPRRPWTFAVFRHQLAKLEATSGVTPLPPVTTTGAFDFFQATSGETRTRARVDVAGYGFAVARSIGPRMSLGVTLIHNEALLDAQRSSTVVETIPDVRGDPQPRRFDFASSVRGEDSDLTVNLGVRVQPGNLWTFGASYREGASFALAELETIEDFEGPTLFRSLPAADFRLPDVLSAGAAVDASRNLIVSLEWDRVRYSRLRGPAAVPVWLANYLAMEPDAIDRLGRFSVDDADELRAGLEYSFWRHRLVPAIRFGVWYDPEHKVRFESSVDCPEPAVRRENVLVCLVDQDFSPDVQGKVEDAAVANSLELLFPRGEDDLHLTGGFGIVVRNRLQLDAAVDWVSGDRYTLSLSGIVHF